MPENTESKKISYSDNHTVQTSGQIRFCPHLQEKATVSRSVFVYLWLRNIFPANMLAK